MKYGAYGENADVEQQIPTQVKFSLYCPYCALLSLTNSNKFKSAQFGNIRTALYLHRENQENTSGARFLQTTFSSLFVMQLRILPISVNNMANVREWT